MSDKQTLERIFNIINTVGQKAISQTDYYADERVGDRKADVISSDGRRLKMSLSLATGVVLIIYIIIIILVGFSTH